SISSVESDNFRSSCVTSCCIGITKTHKNFIWRYVIDGVIEKNIEMSMYSKKRSTNPIAKYDLDGNLVKIYESLSFVQKDGFSEGNVSMCCN
ncbi:hypothetical protein ABK046_46445, partial [Streptomyces caeruleatus]